MHRIHPQGPHLPVSIDSGITLQELIRRIQVARAKPLEVREMSELAAEGSVALCGLWLATPERDLVLHAPSDSTLHRQQFILHELAHMLLMHDTVDGAAGYISPGVFTQVPDVTVVKALARGGQNNALEQEAEMVADAIAERMRERPRSPFSKVFG